MSGWKSGQSGKRLLPNLSSLWGRRRKKPLYVAESGGRWRGRNHTFAQKLEGHLTAIGKRTASHEASISRRSGGEMRRGVRWREILATLAERFLLWLLTGIVFLKNILSFWRDVGMILRELLLRRMLYPPFSFATFAREVQAARLESACRTASLRREPGLHSPEGQAMARGSSLLLPTLEEREEVERAKMFDLDSEEEDLSDEELTDQAWALRSRLRENGREDLHR
ncbi:hypothetical protein [Candidatus Magnetaquicoccus inordinatus]|uniref:hypothetical protein n=1 Tax=Candidatus Magnetaquicoccus inordinatus TaxID=2496818 RepID=UPI00102AC1C2|nr:hypothetical protein [Candidatus Magnetaquicoccus inordinatus]